MPTDVKGQKTLDAANARRARNPKNTTNTSNSKPETKLPATPPNEAALLTMTKESGYEKPKTLRQLEHVVQDNALRGAGFWRKAADALLAIKTHKLWRSAVDEDGNKYPSFVVYAEERFGFKKTYAYDLVKAAQRKPEALTEGSARAEMAAEKADRPLAPVDAILKMDKAWTRFEDSAGASRDRTIDHEDFVHDYDQTLRIMGAAFQDFIAKWTPIVTTAVEVSADAENVPSGHDDSAEENDSDEDGEDGSAD